MVAVPVFLIVAVALAIGIVVVAYFSSRAVWNAGPVRPLPPRPTLQYVVPPGVDPRAVAAALARAGFAVEISDTDASRITLDYPDDYDRSRIRNIVAVVLRARTTDLDAPAEPVLFADEQRPAVRTAPAADASVPAPAAAPERPGTGPDRPVPVLPAQRRSRDHEKLPRRHRVDRHSQVGDRAG